MKIIEKLKEKKVFHKIRNIFTKKSVCEYFENLQAGGKSVAFTLIFAFILMVLICLAVFFNYVRGPERVLVPEVRGKNLREALIEMQSRELYPKITQRYSDNPDDENTILEQSPSAGSIVRGYSRVNLVVSRGVVVQELENYVGQNFDEVKMNIQTTFAGSSNPLIVISAPEYKGDLSAAGTILEQEPPEGTKISEPITLKLVVSRGPNFDNTRVPYLIGKNIEQMQSQMAGSRVIYDFETHFASGDEKAGTVTSQQSFDSEFVKNYSRMTVELALPRGQIDGKVCGIFTDSLINYPYPVQMRLDAADKDGNIRTVVNFLHIGGKVTIPYIEEKGTVLTLYVSGKASKKITVN